MGANSRRLSSAACVTWSAAGLLFSAVSAVHGGATFVEIVVDAAPPSEPHIKAAGDLSGDGLADLFVASSASGAAAWYEAPAWTRHEINLSMGGWSTDAELLDFDGDGDVDVVISQWYVQSWIGWLENPGAGGGANDWTVHVIGSPRAHDISVADLDGDGDLDIVARQQSSAGATITIWRRNSLFAWQSRTIPCPSGEGLHVTDLSGDGRPDAVTGGRWYRAPAGDIITALWTEQVFAPAWTHPDARVASGDLDGDGDEDLALSPAEGTYRLSWFEHPQSGPNGAWAERVIIASVDGAHSLAIGDLNCDGENDVVTATMHQYTDPDFVRVYSNNGGGVSWTAQTLSLAGSHNLGLVDLGADGDLDLFGSNWGGPDPALRVWQNSSSIALDCPSDGDRSGEIGFTDLTALLLAWGFCEATCDCPIDVNYDGEVGLADLVLLLQGWGSCDLP